VADDPGLAGPDRRADPCVHDGKPDDPAAARQIGGAGFAELWLSSVGVTGLVLPSGVQCDRGSEQLFPSFVRGGLRRLLLNTGFSFAVLPKRG
jgi:hypothetical protein